MTAFYANLYIFITSPFLQLPFQQGEGSHFQEVSNFMGRAGLWTRVWSNGYFFLSPPHTALPERMCSAQYVFPEYWMHWSPGTVILFNYFIAPGKDYNKIIHPALYGALIEEPCT